MSSETVAEVVAQESAATELEHRVRELCASIVACEKADVAREEIVKILVPLRRTLVTAYDVHALPRNAFDLVLTEGVLEWLPDSAAVLLLQTVYGVLAPGGTFAFTMLDADDPHRPLFHHFSDAPHYPRTEQDLYRFCARAGISWQNVRLRREERGRALRIEVQKLD